MLSLLTEKDFNEYLWNTDFGEKLELISEEKTQNNLFILLNFPN